MNPSFMVRVCFAGGGLVVLFWTLYFAGPLAPPAGADPLLREVEAIFPFADAVLAAALFAAGLTLQRRRPAGPFLLVAAAAMCLYLGVLDLTFYARRGLMSPDVGPIMLGINALTIGGGLLGLRAGWLLWRT